MACTALRLLRLSKRSSRSHAAFYIGYIATIPALILDNCDSKLDKSEKHAAIAP
jgi:hypothetical protein